MQRTVVAAIALALTALVALPAVGATQRSHGGCAKLTLEFFPKRVHAGDGIDLDFSLTNCSSRTERLVSSCRPQGRVR